MPTAADAGRGGEVYLREFGVIGGADRFAVVGIEIFVDGFDHLKLVQIRQLQESMHYYGNVFVHKV